MTEKVHMTEQEVVDAVQKAFGDLSKNNTKVYLSRNGTPCVIFSDHVGGEAPLFGAWYNGVDTWYPAKWFENGQYPSIDESSNHSDLDLIIDKTKQIA
jgi:hypothetical protein